MKNSCLLIVFSILSTTVFAQRAENPVALFAFPEAGNGDQIIDYAGGNNLQVLSPNGFEYPTGGGITFNEEVQTGSLLPASDVIQSIQTSHSFTAECWISTDNLSQTGPARIFTISGGSGERNFTMAQDENQIIIRTRTTETSENGMPQLESGVTLTAGQLTHVVYVFNQGEEKVYANGEEIISNTRGGSLDNWEDYHMAVGNEIGASRPWIGSMFLCALYDRALTSEEIAGNFEFGQSVPIPDLSEETCAEPNCFVNGFGADERALWLPNLPDGVFRKFEFDEDGGHFEVFPDGTAHIYGNTINLETPEYGWYIDVWLTDKMDWDEWSALGRNWKGNANIVGDLYQTWDYYILDPERENKLVGTGLYEGSQLDLTHRPADYEYGFQVGLAANDQNAEPGMSCWFDYTGTIDGEEVSHHGDINLEGGCTEEVAIACPIDVEISCEEGSFSPDIAGLPEVFCDQEYTFDYNDVVISEDCPRIIERTFTVTFTDGSTATCSQMITLVDESVPVFENLPEDMTVACGQIPEPDILVTDECGFGEVEWWVEEAQFSGACLPTIQRVFTAQDACGNTINHTQYISLEDNVPPAFMSTLDDITLECGDEIPNTLPLAIDDCSEPTITYTIDTVQTSCPLILNQTFTASDLCGQSASTSRLITIVDIEAPTLLGELADVEATCDNIPSSELEFIDACSEVEVEFMETIVGEGCEYEILRVWMALDACGNQSVFNQVITVVDNVGPSISGVEAEMTASCDQINFISPVITDNCGLFTSVLVEETLESEEFCYDLQRTWIATDECGNETSFTQILHVTDDEAPILMNVPTSGTISCGELDEMPEVIAMDNCLLPLPVTVEETITEDNCQLSITRVYTAVDACGNTTSETVVWEYADAAAPQISGSTEVFTTCSEIQTDELIEVVDDCLHATEITFEDTLLASDGCSETILRLWTATDGCGNTSEFQQTIYLTDESGPVFT
ncbi:MAG: LamG domain-containing protein, partial [Flavobacteriales bacterium]|nr:LamG domain-containing protein [Flavobacteriales bacterium]